MNRQERRSSDRQGPGDEEGTGAGRETLVPDRRSRLAEQAATTTRRRTTPRQFLHEVNGELRKVVWPTRSETINYSTVVFITLAVLMALIFGLDSLFIKVATFLFT